MKKKILLSLVALFLVSVFVIKLNADTLMQVGFNTEAKAPSTIPGNGEDVYATITDPFDFSLVKFKKDGSADIAGISDLRKIIIGNVDSSLVTDINVTLELGTYLKDYFTAYCLDANKKYPGYGIFSYADYADAQANGDFDRQIEDIVTVAIANNATYKGIVDRAVAFLGNTYYGDPVVSFTLPDGEDNDSTVTKFESNQQVTINVKSISFSTADGSKVIHMVINDEAKANIGEPESPTVKYEYLTDNHSAENLPITAKLSELALQKYVAKDDTSISGYSHALWIVEHSYPTLTMAKSLEAAGTSLDDLKTDVKALPGNSGLTDEQATELAEAYVYGTVQYAIWRVTGYEVEGKSLEGYNKIDTDTFASLNALYTYLINADVDSNYTNADAYSTAITVNSPAAGKELHEKKNDNYYYGPFSGTYNALVDSTAKMTVTLTNTDTTGIKVVDENYNEITEVAKGQKFYIQVSKNAKVGNVTATLSLDGVETFKPYSNRGRVYYPYYTMGQNALSGGKVTTTTIEGNLDVVTNAKTGVQNVALLLMVTLVAFTLGYLVLSYKSKPVSLN